MTPKPQIDLASRLARFSRRAAPFAVSMGLAVTLPACGPDFESSDEFANVEEMEDNLATAEQELVTDTSVNLAFLRPTSQSSTVWSGWAGRAVDGVTNGDWGGYSVTHTNEEFQPWWQVDLGTVQLLGSVVIFNRTDCCSDRLSNFKVLVSDDGINNWRLAAIHPGATPSQLKLNLVDRATGRPMRGRFVRVQLNGTNALSLAEVQVYAPPLVDLAYKATTSQSSTYNSDGAAWHATDGRTDGSWGNRSVTHTNQENQPWLKVDLGSIQPITGVVLWNRTDCCSSRLSNFRLMLSNDNINWTSYNYPGTVLTSATFHLNASARFVTVQLNGAGVLSLAEIQVLAAPDAARVRSVDFGGAAPGSTSYLERWGDSGILDPYLDPVDRHFVGDFTALGRDQIIHFDRTGTYPAPARILDYAGAPAPAGGNVRSVDTWMSSDPVTGMFDDGDRQFVGDFTNAGRDQLLFINRAGGGGSKILIQDYSNKFSTGTTMYAENWGDSALLNGWLDNNDLQLAGDFMGLGRSQIMYINRGGSDGKVMIMDYAGAVPGQARYFENWGQNGLLSGWLDANDLQFVGDFMGVGHDQVMFINRGGADGKVMIVDYSSGVVPGAAWYWENWGQSTQLNGWIDDGDRQFVGDFTGVGHDQLLLFNTKNENNGKLQVLDYGAGTWPAAVKYLQAWAPPGDLNDWPAPNDLLLTGKLTSSGRDELLAHHVGQSASFVYIGGNPGTCPAGHILALGGGCAPGCPAGQTLLEDTLCVTLVPYSGVDLPDGARAVLKISNRVKAQTTGNMYTCDTPGCMEPFGPAWLDTTFNQWTSDLNFTANPGQLRASHIMTAEVLPTTDFPTAFALRFAGGWYLGRSLNYANQLVANYSVYKSTFRFNHSTCALGLSRIDRMPYAPYTTDVKPILFEDDGTGRTVGGVNLPGKTGCTPIEVTLVE